MLKKVSAEQVDLGTVDLMKGAPEESMDPTEVAIAGARMAHRTQVANSMDFRNRQRSRRMNTGKVQG